MGDNTRISWTDATWNPIRAKDVSVTGFVTWGCMKVSAGCDNCYASTLSKQRGGMEYPKEGPANLGMYNSLQLHEPTLFQPERWKRPRKIFVCSMTDLFGTWVPDSWIEQVFDKMGEAAQRTFQVLTKRAPRMRDFMLSHPHLVFPNVWLGVTVESQALAFRLNYLRETPAAIRWVSAEPLLGPLDLIPNLPDWVIIGGESGPGYRPMDLQWARGLNRQCAAHGVPVWYKQGSSLRPGKDILLDGVLHQEFPR